jgi:hypothetical protein
MAVDIGQGTYVTFGTALAGTAAYKITGVNHGGITRAVADATHMLTLGGKQFVASEIYDPGELSIEVLFDPSIKPISIYWANGGNTTVMWSAYGFASGFEAGAQMEDMMSGTLTIKLSGSIT